MKKRYISFLLFLTMLMTLVPATAFADPAAHSNEHSGWTQWNDSTQLPTEEGFYLLTTDVAISSTWIVTKGATNLCLNGHVIKASGSAFRVITIGSESALNLYDCGSNSTHHFEVDNYGRYSLNESSGAVVITGGCITGGKSDNGGGVYVYDGGVFNMYGGNIVGNTSSKCGGGVYVSNASFSLKDGCIIWNSSDITAAGVYFNGDFITIGGIAKVTENYKVQAPIGPVSNLYLAAGKTVALDSPQEGMCVGITTETLPTSISTVAFTSNDILSDAGFFFSDSDDYYVDYDATNNCLILDNSYLIYVGGTLITKRNNGNVLGDGKVSYDPDTQTLTLSNASITTYYNRDSIITLGIFSWLPGTDTLKIELIGNNVIGVSSTSAPDMGINTLDCDLVFSGSGDLTIYSLMSGIYSSALNITFDESFTGKLTVHNNGDEYYSAFAAIQVLINGGTFTIDCLNGECIQADSVVISGGTFELESTSCSCIYVEDSLEISGGKFELKSSDSICIMAPSVVISGGTFELESLNSECIYAYYVEISDGTFKLESPNSECIYVEDSVVISGGGLIIKGNNVAINTVPAIAAALPVIASTNYDGSNPDEVYSPDAIDTYKYLKIGTVTEPTPTPAPDYSDYVAPKTKTFADVTADDYFYNAVKWAARKGITEGTDDTHFSPNDPITRAQAVTFLWRAAGSPKPTGNALKFTDVESGSYYEKAVAWAIEKGITKGTTDTTFSPEAICNRAQIITFLARFAGVEDADTESVFTDVPSTAYYAAAVKWAKDNGITDGTSETTFSPDIDCTRAQAVTFLYRLKVK